MPLALLTAALTLTLAFLVPPPAAAQPRPGPVVGPAPTHAEARAALERFMSERAAAGFSGVVLVARQGTILLERGYGFLDAGKTMPVSTDSVFTTGSITKQFTAAAILKLEMAGKLRTDDPMATYLPGVPAEKRAITLHQLLTHTAGFAPALGDDLAAIDRNAYIALAMAQPLAHRPGTYDYSNVGYSLLAAIIEIVSGERYEDFLARELFMPAGMKDTGYSRPKWPTARLARGINDDGTDRGTFGERAMPSGTPGWHLLGNGGILSTAGDMYRWHQALGGTAVLSEEAKAKLFRGWVAEGGGSSYGYGWSVEETTFGRLVTHNGGNPYFFSDFLRYVDRDVVVYFSTNSRAREFRRLGRPLAQIAMTGRVLDAPPRAFTPAELATSPAGALVRALLAAVRADDAGRRAAVNEVFSARLVNARGPDALVQLCGRLAEDIGNGEVRSVEEARGPAGNVVAVRVRIGREGRPPLVITLQLDPPAGAAPQPRVDGVEVEVG